MDGSPTGLSAAAHAGPDEFVSAIQQQRLPEYAQSVLDDPAAPEDARETARAAMSACRVIGDRVEAEQEDVVEILRADGITTTSTSPDRARQLHRVEIRVADRSTARRAVEALTTAGYTPRIPDAAGAQASFWSISYEVGLLRQADVTFDVRIRWADDPDDSPVWSLLRRMFRPTPADWDAVDLPLRLHVLYRGVRPTRLVVDRLRRRPAARDHLEPFLATPRGLLDPLVALAAPTVDDTVADLGSGDGRLVIEAAERTGCRAVGYEISAELCTIARAAAAESDAADRIRIVEGDAGSADLSDVDVVFVFLPLVVFRRLLPGLLDRLPAGARVIAHEQSPLGPGLSPDRSGAVIGADAVSVAHEWVVQPRAGILGHT